MYFRRPGRFFITMTVEIFLPILNYNVESWSGTLKRGTRAAQEQSLSGLKNPGHDLCLMSAFFRALCTKRIDNTVVGNEAKKSHFLIRTRNLSYEYFYLLFYEKKWDQNSIYFWEKNKKNLSLQMKIFKARFARFVMNAIATKTKAKTPMQSVLKSKRVSLLRLAWEKRHLL